MKVLYGQRGEPVGSIDADAAFLRDGEQVAQIIGGYLFKVDDGEWIGSLMSGIIFNVHGAPQAFTSDCNEALVPPLPSEIRGMLPLKLRAVGEDVRKRPSKPIPKFLADWLSSNLSTASRDGYFA